MTIADDEAQYRVGYDRAWALLLSHLTPEQCRTMNIGFFDVVTPEGRRWRIYTPPNSLIYNIRLLEDPLLVGPIPRGPGGGNIGGEPQGYIPISVSSRICVRLSFNCPPGDWLLAQKLMLESPGGEALLLEVANG
jgi:hypothetical protein